MSSIVDIFVNNNKNVFDDISVDIDHFGETTVYAFKLVQRMFGLAAAMKIRQVGYDCEFIIGFIWWRIF